MHLFRAAGLQNCPCTFVSQFSRFAPAKRWMLKVSNDAAAGGAIRSVKKAINQRVHHVTRPAKSKHTYILMINLRIICEQTRAQYWKRCECWRFCLSAALQRERARLCLAREQLSACRRLSLQLTCHMANITKGQPEERLHETMLPSSLFVRGQKSPFQWTRFVRPLRVCCLLAARSGALSAPGAPFRAKSLYFQRNARLLLWERYGQKGFCSETKGFVFMRNFIWWCSSLSCNLRLKSAFKLKLYVHVSLWLKD